MKHKMILLALAATVSLGACCAPNETAMNNKQNTHVVRGEKLRRADVRKVQKSLTHEGFYKGKIDGIWGVQTSQAILDYQTVRHPGQTDMTVDTLQEFGVRMDRDHHRSHKIN